MSDDFNVIPIAKARGPLMRSKRTRYSAPDGGVFCIDHAFDLDPNDLSIQCRQCKRFFEPFAALLHLAEHWDKYGQQLSLYRADLEKIREERDRLGKEIVALKATGRKLGGTDSALKKKNEEIAQLRAHVKYLEHRYESIPPQLKRQITAARRGGGGDE